jgi:hypothetical protein
VHLATNDVEETGVRRGLVAKKSVFLQILGYALANHLEQVDCRGESKYRSSLRKSGVPAALSYHLRSEQDNIDGLRRTDLFAEGE